MRVRGLPVISQTAQTVLVVVAARLSKTYKTQIPRRSPEHVPDQLPSFLSLAIGLTVVSSLKFIKLAHTVRERGAMQCRGVGQ